MAVTLAQAAVIHQDPLERGVMETFVITGAVLDRLPLEGITGGTVTVAQELALPGVEFRAVNAAYTESSGTFQTIQASLVDLGGDVDVDDFIIRTRGGTVADLRAAQTNMKVKSLNYKFQDAFINGDTAVDANSFNGLKKVLAGAQLISSGANGAAINTDNAARYAFMGRLDELIGAVRGGPDVLYMNRQVRAQIISAARQVGGVQMGLDDFGRQVSTYNGIPLVDLGTKADGTTQIIPQTETQGTATNTSSIYAVRFGINPEDGAVTGITNGGVRVRDLGELETKPVWRTRISFYCGVGVFGPGAARLTGVIAA